MTIHCSISIKKFPKTYPLYKILIREKLSSPSHKINKKKHDDTPLLCTHHLFASSIYKKKNYTLVNNM